MKKIILMLTTFLFAINFIGCGEVTKQENVVLFINDFPVYKEELEMHLNLLKTRVAAEIEQEYDLIYEDDSFWEKSADGKTVGEILMNRAVEQVVNWHTQFDLATKNNVENCHRDYFEWQKECEDYRKQLKDNNMSVADNLSFDTYMSGQLAYIRINLIEKFKGDILTVSDDEIAKVYAQNKNTLIDASGNIMELENIKEDISYSIFEEKYEAHITTLAEGASIKYVDNFKEIDFSF